MKSFDYHLSFVVLRSTGGELKEGYLQCLVIEFNTWSLDIRKKCIRSDFWLWYRFLFSYRFLSSRVDYELASIFFNSFFKLDFSLSILQ